MAFGWSNLTAEGRKYFDELQKLEKMEVQVGFQEGEMHVDAEGNQDATLAEIAAFNEFGTSIIPARPFMKQSFENHEKELQNACDQVDNMLASGGTVEQGLKTLGVYLKGLVQSEIVEGDFEPNSPYTIAKKGSDTPLIDTGYMRQSVNYVIKKRGS